VPRDLSDYAIFESSGHRDPEACYGFFACPQAPGEKQATKKAQANESSERNKLLDTRKDVSCNKLPTKNNKEEEEERLARFISH
jgi:hypothetical protein